MLRYVIPDRNCGQQTPVMDLNSMLIKHPSSTFFMRVESGEYERMCIYKGDILIIDRARSINKNSLVVYEGDNRFFIGRVYQIRIESILVGAIVHVIHSVKDQC